MTHYCFGLLTRVRELDADLLAAGHLDAGDAVTDQVVDLDADGAGFVRGRDG